MFEFLLTFDLLFFLFCFFVFLPLSSIYRDNYGFVTYYDTDDAFTAIEKGTKLRQPDELPFDICFGGRRQFCRSNYMDLGL